MEIEKDLKALSNPERAKMSAGYFKTGKGEYGEGDVFLGLTVPQQRVIAKKYAHADLSTIDTLMKSNIHEHRFTALEILVMKFETAGEAERKEILDFYLKHTASVNNWDLVDTSAPYIVGEYLLDNDRAILHKLAKSKNIWERRIAIVATFAFIRNNDFKDTLKLSEILFTDSHDLIHKAVGWALREVGKKNQTEEENFLRKFYKQMPRTMLRYAIERFDAKKKIFYMK
ncbi:MAG TPA: DNA alkylation repair protein [archaeon]|nr:DNA alkylation repair protein [archaeon]